MLRRLRVISRPGGVAHGASATEAAKASGDDWRVGAVLDDSLVLTLSLLAEGGVALKEELAQYAIAPVRVRGKEWFVIVDGQFVSAKGGDTVKKYVAKPMKKKGGEKKGH